jgi:hypothetical protein
MTTIEEVIERLPEEYREWARQYGDAIISMGFDELTLWVDRIVNAQWREAYRILAARMTTEQLIASQEAINEKLRALNRRNASFLVMQKQMVKDALTIGVLMLRARVGVE